MLIDRKDLMDLLGLRTDTGPGAQQRYVLADSHRKALFAWDLDGALTAEVSEEVGGGEDGPMVSLKGDFVADEDAFDLTARDNSGESSEPADPRAAAALWRRLVRFMEPSA